MKNHVVTLALLGFVAGLGINHEVRAERNGSSLRGVERVAGREHKADVDRADRTEARVEREADARYDLRDDRAGYDLRDDRAARDDRIARANRKERRERAELAAAERDLSRTSRARETARETSAAREIRHTAHTQLAAVRDHIDHERLTDHERLIDHERLADHERLTDNRAASSVT